MPLENKHCFALLRHRPKLLPKCEIEVDPNNYNLPAIRGIVRVQNLILKGNDFRFFLNTLVSSKNEKCCISF